MMSDGFLQREQGGSYVGRISIEHIDLSPIEGVYFKEKGKNYLWLYRRPVLEYDETTMSYKKRQCNPYWEVYLEKTKGEEGIAYRGHFFFLRFKYNIVGIWDKTLGDIQHRLNLYVDRAPSNEQTIINRIRDGK